MAASVSLLTAVHAQGHTHLILGSNPLAATRCTQSLAAGATPILIAPETSDLHYALQKRIDSGEVKWLKKNFEEADLFTLGREETGKVVDAVFITSSRSNRDSEATTISTLCQKNRIPINVIDSPSLCTFTLLSTHTDGPLQIGVTTNGKGCKLASRIRREISSTLPPNLGSACARLGQIRWKVQEEDALLFSSSSTTASTSAPPVTSQAADANADPTAGTSSQGVDLDAAADESSDQAASFNTLVHETGHTEAAAKTRRIRWLSQVCEYWPLSRLAEVTDGDMEEILNSYNHPTSPDATTDITSTNTTGTTTTANPATTPGADLTIDATTPTHLKKPGLLLLAGSGPGHPTLLTTSTHNAILQADLILADKLVPSPILSLIPRRTPLHIARKFPGNADAAQADLLSRAHAGVVSGLTVLRLKQGDPYIYGRGGEEYKFFDERGLGERVRVLPGVTSALSAPLFAGIPATQRDVADQVLICTGTGKKGKAPVPPEYVGSRTVVFLMALHRISGLVGELTARLSPPTPAAPTDESEKDGGETTTITEAALLAAERESHRPLWPLTTPCAVIERASCPDQRVIRTSLAHVAHAIETEGSRPPGLLVVGKACEALVGNPAEGKMWVVEEGFRGMDFMSEINLGKGEERGEVVVEE